MSAAFLLVAALAAAEPGSSADLQHRFGIPQTLAECDEVGEAISPSDPQQIQDLVRQTNAAKRSACRSAFQSRQTEIATEEMRRKSEEAIRTIQQADISIDPKLVEDAREAARRSIEEQRAERERQAQATALQEIIQPQASVPAKKPANYGLLIALVVGGLVAVVAFLAGRRLGPRETSTDER